MEKLFTDVDVVIEGLDSAEIKTCFIEEILMKLPDKPLIAASGGKAGVVSTTTVR